MVAFRRAIELGADAIEFDVQATSDGHLIVIHDLTLDRTTNGNGPVFTTPLNVVQQLDAGAWQSPTFAGEPVPELTDVLGLDRIEFELELKGYGVAFVDHVLDAVRAAGVLRRVEFTSSNVALLAILKRNEPTAMIGLFSSPQPSWMTDDVFEHHVIGIASTSGADVAHVHAGSITPRIVDRLHDLGMITHANDAADTADIHRALNAGADRVSVDVTLAVGIDRAERSPHNP
jgi:glycerophosphoryl diester phosphodiesterase